MPILYTYLLLYLSHVSGMVSTLKLTRWYLKVGAQLFRNFRKWVGNKVGVGEIFRFLKKMGENGKGGPLGEMEEFGDF